MSTSDAHEPNHRHPDAELRVLVAGGGVAALEAMLALRALAGERVELRLLAGSPDFVYRPLQVLEPFEADAVVRIPWSEIATSLELTHIPEELVDVDPDAHTVHTTGGHVSEYDVLLLAVGAVRRPVIPGALTIGEPGTSSALRALLGDPDAAGRRRIGFVSPPGVSWTLAIYELALLTARWAEAAGIAAELVVFTAEAQPLEVMGADASELARRSLADHGIRLRTGTLATVLSDGRMWIDGEGSVPVDGVVALPRLEGPQIGGVTDGDGGFIVVDEHGRVDGEPDVYAAGDATDFPVKQGGLATQQADTVAAHIAARAGASVDPMPFAPVIRATLLTADGSRFMRRDLTQRAPRTDIDDRPLWWPPAKIAGQHLAPYLATLIS
ncbi:MAG TPA: FAD-dependent oxidoreductase [Solirubrobacteraceae bacterium]|nr:FAD-dependent oxidoreductase [Solirubrobacteraceae bacterium]